jgi:hypothetical protein
MDLDLQIRHPNQSVIGDAVRANFDTVDAALVDANASHANGAADRRAVFTFCRLALPDSQRLETPRLLTRCLPVKIGFRQKSKMCLI